LIHEEGGVDMAHGYLGDGYGTHGEFDPDRDQRDRDRRDRREGRMFGGWNRLGADDRWSERGRQSGESRRLSANPDDHYLSWRDRHMGELDRDYAEYCRERERAFHQDFDAWRRQRHGNPGPLRTGMTQTGISHEPTGELELTNPAAVGQSDPDPIADATLGTTSGGRKRR
jgi:hypothetical protein